MMRIGNIFVAIFNILMLLEIVCNSDQVPRTEAEKKTVSY